MLTAALLTTALLFGGMVLYSFGFAAFLFTALPADVAGPTIRRAFPLFYLFVMATAAGATVLIWPFDPLAAKLLAVIAVTTLPTRQILMPAINRATDTRARARFNALHGLSVVITLVHIVLAGVVLTRFAGGTAASPARHAETSSTIRYPVADLRSWSMASASTTRRTPSDPDLARTGALVRVISSAAICG